MSELYSRNRAIRPLVTSKTCFEFNPRNTPLSTAENARGVMILVSDPAPESDCQLHFLESVPVVESDLNCCFFASSNHFCPSLS